MKKNVNKAVAAVIFINGKILAVSRKYDKNDFGLCGGKVESNEDIYQAIVREVYEETGLTILDFFSVFKRFDDECETTTFFIKSWIGLPKKMEKGEVKFVDYSEIERGSFGKYNTNLKNTLIKKNLFKESGTFFTAPREESALSIFFKVANHSLKNRYVHKFKHKNSEFILSKSACYPILLNNKHYYIITSKEYPSLILKKKDVLFV